MTGPYSRTSRPALAALVSVPLLLAGCYAPLQLEESDHPVVLNDHLLEGPGPSAPGPYTVRSLTYGSGTDRNRPEYAEGVAFHTDSVDASGLVSLGEDADERMEYWGFSPGGFPLNARVWYPEGRGPFPLVLIVHGNHDPRDFSDLGYDYLGEHLAGRGYIAASIDMNFINGLNNENDARGWLLLKHVEAFEAFSRDSSNPFHGLVDLSAVALVGHSRGGEAVANAAAFNRLTHYPDDATVRFDFGHDIRSIVAMAPVDGQYRPTDRHVPVENVNYLVFHGSHDGDVTSPHGTRVYNRVRFTDDSPRLKAAIYVYRANHGQWNSRWRNKDFGPRSERLLDLRGLLPIEDQMEFAKVYVTAFLDTTLGDEDRWLPLFRDHRVAGGWLPETMYITRFQDSSYRSLAGFEEDIDVTSGTVPGVELIGDGLKQWREGELLLRSSNRPTTSRSQESQAVWLGWQSGEAPPEADGRPQADEGSSASADEAGLRDASARYRIVLPETLVADWGLSGDASLQLALAVVEGDSVTAVPGADVDLSVEVVDMGGRAVTVPLSDYGPLREPLEMRIYRRPDWEERFPRLWELLPQSFSIPLSDFTALEPEFRPDRLREIRLVFDRSGKGTVVLDDLGIAFLDPAFTRVRVKR